MKKAFILLALLTTSYLVNSQTYLISSGGTVNTCSGDFYDSGGSSSYYGNNENYTMTFHSNNITNTYIRVYFSSFDVESGDTLIIYNGSNTSASIIGKYNNNNIPPSSVKGTTASGDLTFKFISNGIFINAGWVASVNCTPPCQTVLALLSNSETFPSPDSNYVDVCFDKTIDSTDVITFAALANNVAFPQNGIYYTQNAATSQFIWDFGDGATGTGRVVTHRYSQIQGYEVGLTITDVNGCTNANLLGARVRVSGNPYGHLHPIPDLCSSDTAFISIGYGPSSDIIINNFGPLQLNKPMFDSTLFIPDGPNCSVQCYNTFVTFTAFPTGATIQSANDILGICVNMEHSYAGDLGFRIICPNGQSVQLDPSTHGGGAFLGEPMGGSSHGSYDNGCLPANNPNGVGWTYCWSETYPTQGTLATLQASVSTVDSTNTINHTNYLVPSNPFFGLVGCPFNGTWNIEICDVSSTDNGYVFWWSLELNPNLLPVTWSYSVPIDTITWAGDFIHNVNDSTIMIIPNTGGGGTFPYTVTVTDEYGCSYDTTFNVHVLQTPHVNLGPDSTICSHNGSFILHAGPGMDSYLWNNGLTDSLLFITLAGNYSVTVSNVNIGGALQCSDVDSIYIDELYYVDNGVTQSGDTIKANLSGAQYQWLDCNNNYAPINGQVNQSYTATTNGNYAVRITQGPCSDISACVSITSGIDSYANHEIKVYPNPVTDELIIEAMANKEKINFEIYNSLGRVVIEGNMTEKTVVHTSTFSRGIYLLKLEIGKTVEFKKIVKE